MNSKLILVVDDDPFTLSMVTGVVATSGFNAHGESSATKAVLFAKEFNPVSALLDLDLGTGPTGIDLAIALRKINPQIGIVLLTSYEDPRLLGPKLPQIPIGTKYLVKQHLSAQVELVNTLEDSIIDPLGKVSYEDAHLGEFSDVQIETLRLVAKGLSNSEIAKLRFVTEKTVEQTITRLARQLNIPQQAATNSRVQLARTYFNRTGKTLDSE